MIEDPSVILDIVANKSARKLVLGKNAAKIPLNRNEFVRVVVAENNLSKALEQWSHLDFLLLDFELLPGTITTDLKHQISRALNIHGILVIVGKSTSSNEFKCLQVAHEISNHPLLEFYSIESWKAYELYVLRRSDKQQISRTLTQEKPLRYVIADKVFFLFFGNARFKKIVRSIALYFLNYFKTNKQ